jgi:GT2 family glycosyltransferase
MAPRVSVVICAYTEARWNDLMAAVESVRCQTMPAHQVILVIDHNPGLLERARRHLPGIVAIPNRETKGLSGARNSGIAEATGQIVAFLDDDAIAAPDWLERLVPAYNSPEVIGVGGSIDPAWETGRPAWFPREFDWVIGCTYEGMPTSTADTRNLIGANMSLRREIFDQVGGFLHGIGRVGVLPLGCEETELCIRARQENARGRIVYEPSARVQHRVPASRATWRYFRSRCFAEGISKAQISRLVGAGAGTRTERHYALRTLPRGVVRGLASAVKGDLAGLARAAAITAGLLITAGGYATGLARARATSGSNGEVA